MLPFCPLLEVLEVLKYSASSALKWCQRDVIGSFLKGHHHHQFHFLRSSAVVSVRFSMSLWEGTLE